MTQAQERKMNGQCRTVGETLRMENGLNLFQARNVRRRTQAQRNDAREAVKLALMVLALFALVFWFAGIFN